MRSYKNNLSLRDLPSVRQLRAFTVLYETGNVSAAAQLLSLTQPAITVLLKELEGKLGVRLFERGPRGLTRTEAATDAMIYVQRVLGDLHEMSSSMKSLAQGAKGNLRIAATSTVAQTLIPGLLQRFRQDHPQVRVSLDDCGPHEFVERIITDRVHVGIGTLEAPIPGLTEIRFQQDWLHAVAQADFLPNTSKTLSWKQLEKLPIITVKSGYGVRRSIDQAAAAAHVQLHLAYEVSLLSTALSLAAQGLGVALVPGSIVSSTQQPSLRSCRLVRPTAPRNLSLIYRKGVHLPPTAQALAAMLTRFSSGG